MDDKKKGLPWLGFPGGWFAWWYNQFTQPLIFDDSLSLLQKVCALWALINGLDQRITALEEEIEALKNT